MNFSGGSSETILSLSRRTFPGMDGEQPIRTPARDICVTAEDMPLLWREEKVSVMEQPRFGQRDYATSRFSIVEDGVERAVISFEVVIYSDRHTAANVFSGTLGKMRFLHLARLELGDMGAMIEVPGHPSRRLCALLFTERNVMSLIMLSVSRDHEISDRWLISMGRLMASRIR